MAGNSMFLTPHPAGQDEDLRLALEDLLLDRWLSTKSLLANTHTWALRTSRSQVLAAGAAMGEAITAWCAEEPADANALVMRARVLTHRVLSAHRLTTRGHGLLPRLSAARAACEDAARRWPADPVPWVCMLALAQLDVDHRHRHSVDHWANPPEAMLPCGPWPLLWQVDRRDSPNREAYHRMLQCIQARGQGAVDFTRWVASQAKPGSVLLTLPLYAYVEDFRIRTASGQLASTLGYWTNEQVRYYVELARDGWFAHITDWTACSMVDLNYLACTLTACGLPGAAEAFEAIGSFAMPAPWQQVSETRWWQDDFLQARAFALRRRSIR
ncbi:hypothetical protein [Streptomyces sp. NPDC088254]|uniref:hypothetical protein n=1 Tax=Streptomyces sp. NPDC088254 TaxID=3365847 RepID=UPI00382664E6